MFEVVEDEAEDQVEDHRRDNVVEESTKDIKSPTLPITRVNRWILSITPFVANGQSEKIIYIKCYRGK